MYPHFIEVHDAEDHQSEITVNVANIVNIHVDDDGDTIIEVTSREFYRIAESYSEVKTLIRECGCHIHKGDPRLDTTHPLTMEDLKDMIGEPVWNSNTLDWWLIHWYMEYPTYDEIIVYNNKGVQECWDRNDLVRKPLYRMKP